MTGGGSANWQVLIGVVVENDATDGTAEWIAGPLFSFAGAAIEKSSWTWEYNFDTEKNRFSGMRLPGKDLTVDTTNKCLAKTQTNLKQSDSANWQNDTNRTSPAGTTTKPGVGDLVVFIDELGGSATIAFAVIAVYASD